MSDLCQGHPGSSNFFTVQLYLLIIFTMSCIILLFAISEVIKHFSLSVKFTLWPILKLQTCNLATNLRLQNSGHFAQMTAVCLYLCRMNWLLTKLHRCCCLSTNKPLNYNEYLFYMYL